MFERDHSFVVDYVRGKALLKVARPQEAIRDQVFGTDQQVVAGK